MAFNTLSFKSHVCSLLMSVVEHRDGRTHTQFYNSVQHNEHILSTTDQEHAGLSDTAG
jgi:hypothetical protein